MCSRIAFISCGVAILLLTCEFGWSQQDERLKVPPLRKGRGSFSERLGAPQGGYRTSQDGNGGLPPLKYAVDGMKTSHPRTKEDDKAILVRMRELQEVVNTALPPQGPRPTTEQIVHTLHALHEKSSGTLRNDLENMLICSLVTAKGGVPASNKSLDTNIWSYRRLLNTDNNTATTENWGPTIEIRPDQVLLIPVLNLLDRSELQTATLDLVPIPNKVPSGGGLDGFDNAPQDFDVTNLHTHGLNVSPDWPSDDIFRQIHPDQLKFFIYQIPPDHPAGTFFYHPHHHGSVATQVAGGMAGALIVRDESKGLDRAGIEYDWGSESEEILLIQQLSLFQENPKCDTDYFTRPDFFALKDVGPWTGDQDDWVKKCHGIRAELGRLATLLVSPNDMSPYPFLAVHKVATWVSGGYQPVLWAKSRKENSQPAGPLAPGEVRRVRLIHAGVESNVELHVRFLRKNKNASDPPEHPDIFVPFQVVARDGIPLKSPILVDDPVKSLGNGFGDVGTFVISPGNRADILIPTPATTPPEGFLDTLEVVTGDGSEADLPLDQRTKALEPIATILIDRNKPRCQGKLLDVDRALFIYENKDGRNAPGFHRKHGVTADFKLTFNDAIVNESGDFTPGVFEVDGKTFPFDEHAFQLGTTSHISFQVTPKDPLGDRDRHPFHIHVNPFLIPSALNNYEKGIRKVQGLPLTEFWADTILVYEGEPMTARMPFTNWTGRFVGHCHILDHEDGGMMSKLRIDPTVNGIPKPAVSGVLTFQEIPRTALDNVRQEWPTPGGPIPSHLPGYVSLFVFMPKTPKGACPHCSESVKAVAKLRSSLSTDQLKIRIVAITNGNGDDLPSVDVLGLKDQDVLCSDVCHNAFEACGLIDSTPAIDSQGGLTFPWAFCATNRCLKHDSDLMHGMFIASPDGKIYSHRRGFAAFDEIGQIAAEIKLASIVDPEVLRKTMEERLQSIPDAEEQTILKSHMMREVESRESFLKSK